MKLIAKHNCLTVMQSEARMTDTYGVEKTVIIGKIILIISDDNLEEKHSKSGIGSTLDCCIKRSLLGGVSLANSCN